MSQRLRQPRACKPPLLGLSNGRQVGENASMLLKVQGTQRQQERTLVTLSMQPICLSGLLMEQELRQKLEHLYLKRKRRTRRMFQKLRQPQVCKPPPIDLSTDWQVGENASILQRVQGTQRQQGRALVTLSLQPSFVS